MTHPQLPWPIDALTAALAAHWPGARVEALAEVDSTNSELMRRARSGDAAPALLVAEAQSAGRGRLGRVWHGGSGALTFSLGLLLAPQDWSGLSLAIGLALAEALHPEIRLKWPNDLWWQGRKLAGILVETASSGGARAERAAARYAVIGIGINIAPLDGAGFSTPPACLQELLPGITAPAALARIAAPLARALRAFEREGFAPLMARFNARDALAGQPVRLSDGAQGQAQGAGPSGALRVQTPAGLREVISAEVSVRPLVK
jgi:BirA family biotin operon repressor/biotin-[acetyl-CoA-carboxylase] ligase